MMHACNAWLRTNGHIKRQLSGCPYLRCELRRVGRCDRQPRRVRLRRLQSQLR